VNCHRALARGLKGRYLVGFSPIFLFFGVVKIAKFKKTQDQMVMVKAIRIAGFIKPYFHSPTSHQQPYFIAKAFNSFILLCAQNCESLCIFDGRK